MGAARLSYTYDNRPYRTQAEQPVTTSLAHTQSPHPLGRAFSDQSDLVPLFLLRYDRPNTRRSYERDLLNFFGSEAVTLEMAREVSFPHVNEFVQRLETDGKSPATIRRHTATLRGFFGWLVALGLLPHNPADRNLVRRVSRDRPKTGS